MNVQKRWSANMTNNKKCEQIRFCTVCGQYESNCRCKDTKEAEVDGVKRYTFSHLPDCDSNKTQVYISRSNGKWVKWSDHESAMKIKDNSIMKFKDEFLRQHEQIVKDYHKIKELESSLKAKEEENKSLKEQIELWRNNGNVDHQNAHNLIIECYRGGIIDMVWLKMLVSKKFKDIDNLESKLKDKDAEIERLKAELDELDKDKKEQVAVQMTERGKLIKELQASKDRAEKLVEALESYGQHSHLCKTFNNLDNKVKCDCGLDQALTYGEDK